MYVDGRMENMSFGSVPIPFALHGTSQWLLQSSEEEKGGQIRVPAAVDIYGEEERRETEDGAEQHG